MGRRYTEVESDFANVVGEAYKEFERHYYPLLHVLFFIFMSPMWSNSRYLGFVAALRLFDSIPLANTRGTCLDTIRCFKMKHRESAETKVPDDACTIAKSIS